MKFYQYSVKTNHLLKLSAKLFFISLLLTIGNNLLYGQSSQTYTSSGTFTVPSGVYSIIVECWGGGGGGGGSNVNASAGGGGGGGAFSRNMAVAVVPGNTYTVTVGAAGSAGAAAGGTGGTGGTSSFNSSTVIAVGGSGGVGGVTGSLSGAGGTGGSSASGTGSTKYSGGSGATAVAGSYSGGGGGSAGTGSSGNSATNATGAVAVTGGGAGGNGGGSNAAGSAGSAPGGGGGGGRRTTGTNRAGGAGAVGRVIIAYYLPSTPATSAWGTPAIICSGSSATLSNSGGTLGDKANWYWYTGSCGGTYIISGSSPVIQPTSTTVYYVRAENVTNTTTCVTADVTVDIPAAPVSVLALPDTVSCGDSISLSASSTYKINWYVTASGGTTIGSSSSGLAFYVYPLSSPISVFFAETQSVNGCPSQTRIADSVYVTPGSLPNLVNVYASPSAICYGQTSSLTATGIGIVRWWNAPSGGILSGTSQSGSFLSVSPPATIVYYAENYGSCGTSPARVPDTVFVDVASMPSLVSAFPDSIICGNSSILSASSSFRINWYSLSTGGTLTGSSASGSNFQVTPLSPPAVIYYAESYDINGCPSSSRVPDTVFISATPNPVNVTGSPLDVCPGQSSTLLASCNYGIIRWWNAPTGGTMLCTRLSGSGYVVTPTSATVYYAEAFSACGVSSRIPDSIFYGGFTPPTSVTATPSTYICGVGQINLIGTGTSSSIGWYDSATGGNFFGTTSSGSSFIVSPTSTMTYYAECESWTSGSQTFAYSGSKTTFTVPSSVISIGVDVSGAQGTTTSLGTGGLGGRVQTTLTVTPGQLLYILVGGHTASGMTGGWNGGANGYNYYSPVGGGGGGASDIRTGGSGLTNRIVVAGGGGGAGGDYGAATDGGAGGGLVGGNGLSYSAQDPGYAGQGGSQTAGGMGGTYGPGSQGTLGNGGAAYTSYASGGGGGGGYYGGGGAYDEAGGGGGSSWVSAVGSSNIVHTQGYRTGNGQIIISWNAIACLSSSRTPVTVTVNTPSVPSNISATPSIISCAGSTNLNASSVNGVIRWWDSPSGGNMVGTSQSGMNLSVFPPGITTIYYAESYTTCASTPRIADTVFFSTTIGPSAIANPGVVCSGAMSNFVGFAPGNIIRWWDSPYGGTSLGTTQSGANFLVLPTTTTTYYAENYIGSSGSLTFNYSTSKYIAWNVPMGAMSVNVDVSGAQGGTYSVGYGSGGQGGRVQTTLSTSPGETLYISVGQAGSSSITGGWWGGADGGSNYSGGGGGSSDIRVGGTAVTNRVIVAGGGGGNCGYSAGINDGGAGGGLTGGNGLYSSSYSSSYCGAGGTQSTGGMGASNGGNNGILGKGGAGNSYAGGGGGAGYFGGGGGYYYGGGGGGSSWVNPSMTSNTTHTQGYSTGNGQVTISWNVAPCTGGRTSVTVSLGTPSDPTNVTCSPTSLSCGSTISLNATNNGFLVTWWDSPTGGNIVGTSLSGTNFVTVPTSSTTYYAESDAFVTNSQTYGFTGIVQTFTVPSGVTSIMVDASGAQGSSYDTTVGIGGLGGRVQTMLSVSSGQILYIRIGGQSLYNTVGWNGGGCGSGCSGLLGGGGGGATDIRIGGIALINRVLVAGGGGGGGYGTSVISCNGGSGGDIVAGNGSYNGAFDATKCGTGGTQVSGGAASTGGGTAGSLGTGGVSAQSFGEGGGGGGYYGGGGGSSSGGGGGGSSWADPALTTGTLNTQGYKYGNGAMTFTWNSLSCYSTDRISVSVTVTPIANPSNVLASPNPINCSASSSISANSVGIIRWWSSPTGGILLATTSSGIALMITPTITTIYYAEAYQNPCQSSIRISLTLTVIPIPSPSVTATPSSYCTSGTSNLNAVSTGNTIKWWTQSFGGTLLATSASGINFPVSPTVTSTYYVDATQNNSGSLTYTYTGAVQTWDVPTAVTTITLDVSGASGGYVSGGTAGRGARIVGNFSVTPGQVLSILVGQSPGLYSGSFSAGGGGSFVASGSNYSTATPLIVAGGGGGAYTGYTGVDAPTSTSGTGSNPGTNGNGAPSIGGSASSTCGGGGGGFYTSGTSEYYSFTGGAGFQQGGAGGAPSTTYASSYQTGGFGGGAPADYVGSCNLWSGSGGGYSGGSAYAVITTSKYSGEAGGSYNGGTNQQNYSGNSGNTGNGQVILTYFSPSCVSNRVSVTVTVNVNSIAPSSAFSTPTSICPGTSATLNINGGSLSPGANWYWYKGACGGSAPIVGTPATDNPSTTTTYFVRAQGICNTTACISTTVILNSNSSSADSIFINPSTICIGSAIAIVRYGGVSGTGAAWYWYTGSCGGLPIGTGSMLIEIPSTNMTYYVRAEGVCNTTACVNDSVIVNTNSVLGPSAICSPQVICPGSGTTLGVPGTMLGTNGNLFWYQGYCGGTLLGSGINYFDSPSINTTYYVRAEGICNTTNCLSAKITINTVSIPATVATGSPSEICTGSSSVLGLSGGLPGLGAGWVWYSGTCGGTFEGMDTMITVIPPVTTEYYVRAENICNTTSCASITIIVNVYSVNADSLSSTPPVICSGNSAVLGVKGGTLGSGGAWGWYAGSCGGVQLGNDSIISVAPTATIEYFLRAEGTCNTTGCLSTEITVNTNSLPVNMITATNDTICEGNSTGLEIYGGQLGTGGIWNWYSGSCGGNSEGNGTYIVASPSSTSTYYVRAEGVCNTTICDSIVIVVNTNSSGMLSITAIPDTICPGTSITLGGSGGQAGTGGIWYWYAGYCGGIPEGSGISIIVAPDSTTDYYLRAEGTCNTTACLSINVVVNTNSISADTITSTNDTICEGNPITLGFTGGIAGTGGYWSWFTGTCGGNGIGIGQTIADYPVVSTIYYLRAEGTCNTTQCISKEIIIQTYSTGTIAGLPIPDTICYGNSSNLVITGGQLGTGGDWHWYSSSCGGTTEGVGYIITVSPFVTTDYYVRAEGDCNTTSCIILQVAVLTNSLAGTMIMPSNDTICESMPTTLNIIGGQLGTGGDWYWYEGACGGTPVDNGSTITVSPSVNTDYYARAEGTCNTTSCADILITVNDSSETAAILVASPDTICEGESITLAFSGGFTGTGADWHWYSSSCGGIPEGVGSTITVTPAVTVYYYVRAEGVCNTTSCLNRSITVNDSSLTAVSLIASSDTICYGESSTLMISGGFTGTGADWYWYTGSCGGTPAGNGNNITINPAITTDYYSRAEGICNTTGCLNLTIVVNFPSANASAVTATQTAICSGSATSLLSTGGALGTGGNWYWYSGSCGGTLIGNDTIEAVSPAMTQHYYLRAEGVCNTTNCQSILITILPLPDSPVILTSDTNGFCSDYGGLVNLSSTGGYGNIFMWYTDGCGITPFGTGTSLTFSAPVFTTVYYGNWQTLHCGNSTCLSIELTVVPKPAEGLTAYPSPDTIGTGQSSVLTVTGSLSSGEVWTWYENNCGAGIAVGTGASIELYPLSTTIYYVRAENGLCYSDCITATVTIPGSLNNAGLITILPSDTICYGDTVVLGVANSLNGGNWYWYTGSCGGTLLGTGLTISISPISTTTFNVRQELGGLTSSCESRVVHVKTLSAGADSITTVSQTVCQGNNTSLSISGGYKGTSANWYWYGNLCGGVYESSGISIIVNPAVTMYYYVRAEGACNTTGCASINITVNDSSATADSVTAILSTICIGSSDALVINGGVQGTSAGWYWYSGSCGGTPEGNGTSIIVSPQVTTGYFARAEGICNTTACKNILITVNDSSSTATSTSASQSTICEGSSTTLAVIGGILGTGAGWHWYFGSCGGSPEGNGNSLAVSPSVTSVYYVRAEGTCNTTICKYETITVNTNTLLPDSIISYPGIIIIGSGSTLTVSGGTTGTGANWYWYTGSCEGANAGTGDTLTVNPLVTTTYYLNGEGVCNTTSCISTIITVYDTSVSAGSVISAPAAICEGDSTILAPSGGALGTGAVWHWYSPGCGGTPEGAGGTITVHPSVTTDYYVRAEGIVNTTGCVYTTVIVNTLSLPGTVINATKDTIHTGGNDTLSLAGGVAGTSAVWYWYAGGCGSIPAGTGTSITVAPTVTTDYYINAQGLCNTTPCLTKEIVVIQGYSVSGTILYDQTSYPLDSVWLFIQSNGNTIDSTRADINGYYHFNLIQNGTYKIKCRTHKPWGGVNSTDAVKVKRHFAGSEYFTSSLRLHAADVNLSGNINTTDAVKITRRFVGSDTSFTRGDWNFEKPFGGDTINVSPMMNDTVIVNGNNITQDFRGICIGDVNGSNVPSYGAKAASRLSLENNDVRKINAGEYFELPLKVTDDLDIGAISVILDFPEDLIHVVSVKKPAGEGNDNLFFRAADNELRIGWFYNTVLSHLYAGDTVLIIEGRTSDNFTKGDIIQFTLKNSSLNEIADGSGIPYDNVVLRTTKIEHSDDLSSMIIAKRSTNEINIFPNPVNDKLFIENAENSDIFLINLFGKIIGQFKCDSRMYTIDLSGLQESTYFVSVLTGNTTTIKKIVVIK